MIDNTWKLWLPLTAVHFSKQNSTFVADFFSNMKISGGAQTPLPFPLLRACCSWQYFLHQFAFTTASQKPKIKPLKWSIFVFNSILNYITKSSNMVFFSILNNFFISRLFGHFFMPFLCIEQILDSARAESYKS